MANIAYNKKQPTEQELEDALKKVRTEKYESTKEVSVNKSISELLNEQLEARKNRNLALGDAYKELERRINRRLGSQFNREGSSPTNPKIINK